MTIYRCEVVSADSVDSVNRLLTQGWKPSREVPLDRAASKDGAPSALVILERDDTEPLAHAARLGDDVPVEQLADVPILDGLTHEELVELVAISEVRSVPQGQIIFEQNSENGYLAVILQGEVELKLPTAGSLGTHIMRIGEHDVFGESSFFSGGPHAASATAATNVRLLVIPRDGYDDLLQASRPVAWKLAVNAAGILGVRLQETDGWLSEILQHEEDARIAQSWQRFRENAGRSSFRPRRFFGT